MSNNIDGNFSDPLSMQMGPTHEISSSDSTTDNSALIGMLLHRLITGDITPEEFNEEISKVSDTEQKLAIQLGQKWIEQVQEEAKRLHEHNKVEDRIQAIRDQTKTVKDFFFEWAKTNYQSTAQQISRFDSTTPTDPLFKRMLGL